MAKAKPDNKQGLPNKNQLLIMMKRYSSIKITPKDNGQQPMSIHSESSQFRKPIFFDTDCGKMMNKIKMALKQQAFYPHDNADYPSKIELNGNVDLVQRTCDYHYKLQGDHAYDIKKPFDHHLYLIQGDNIPEYILYEQEED